MMVLALGNLAVGTSAYMQIGVLEPIARAFAVSVGLAGQLGSLYAVVYAVAAPLLVLSTYRVRPKYLLATALLLLALGNAGSALSASFATLLLAKAVIALGGAMFTPLSLAFAAYLVTTARRGTALALANSGVLVAPLVGLPLGALLGGWLGWQAAFVLATVVSLAALGLLLGVLPDAVIPQKTPLRNLGVVLRRDVMTLNGVTILRTGGIACVILFISPVVVAITGYGATMTSVSLFVFGVFGMFGVLLGGRLADRFDAVGVLLGVLFVLFAGMTLFALLLSFPLRPYAPAATLFATALVGLASAAFLPLLRYLLVNATETQSSMLLSVNASLLFVGQGLGVALGGLLIETIGTAALGYAAALLLLGALLAARWLPRRLAESQPRAATP